MEEILEEVLYVKTEPDEEDPVDYPLPELEVVVGPLAGVPTTASELVDQYCRLCLRDKSTLFPIMTSQVQNIMIPDLVAAVTGVCINPRDSLPKKVCIQCVVKLDYAYHIRLEFAESYRVLKSLNGSKVLPLWECLRDFQTGVLATAEKRSEKLLRQNRHVLRKEFPKKEQQEVATTRKESSVGKCDVEEERKAEQSSYHEVEMILKPEECLNEVSQANYEEQAKHDATTKEGEGTQTDSAGELDETHLANSGTEKEHSEAIDADKLRTVLNYRVEINESKLDPNKCYICNQDFASANDVEIHLPEHADMVPYECEECKSTRTEYKTIYTLIMLHRHFRMHAGSIKCPECAFRTCTIHGLYGHIKRYHMEDTNTVFTCEICGAAVKNHKTFEVHTRMHKAVEEGKYTCSFCARKFGTKSRLIRHERTHTNERPYQCRYCPKAFTNETTFQSHERSHTNERGYRCEECEKRFHTRGTLSQHMALAHGGVKSDGSLPTGSGAANVKSYLFETPVKCSYEGCDFETNVRSKYYNHKAKHDLKFQCPHCEERYPTKQRLDMHSYVHTALKPHCCDVCGKSFRFRNSFVEHMASHNNIRPYSCTVCSMSFVRDRNLKEHMLKHSDQLTYACRHCGKKFRYRADLSKHEKSHLVGEASKEEVIVDFEAQGGMDMIVEEYEVESEVEGEAVEFLDE